MVKTDDGGEGPYLLLRNYGSEGWSIWRRFQTPTEAVEEIMTVGFSEEALIVKEIVLDVREREERADADVSED